MPAVKMTEVSMPEISDDSDSRESYESEVSDTNVSDERNEEASGEESEEDIETLKQRRRAQGLSNVMNSLLRKSDRKEILSESTKKVVKSKKKKDEALVIVDEASGKNEEVVVEPITEDKDDKIEPPKAKRLRSDISYKIRQNPKQDSNYPKEKKYISLATKGVVDLLNYLRQQEEIPERVNQISPAKVPASAITNEASAMNCGKNGLLKLLGGEAEVKDEDEE